MDKVQEIEVGNEKKKAIEFLIDNDIFYLLDGGDSTYEIMSKDNPQISVKGMVIYSYRVETNLYTYKVYMGLKGYYGAKEQWSPLDTCVVKKSKHSSANTDAISRNIPNKELTKSEYLKELNAVIMESALSNGLSLIVNYKELGYKSDDVNLRIWEHKIDNHIIYIGVGQGGQRHIFDNVIHINSQTSICYETMVIDDVIGFLRDRIDINLIYHDEGTEAENFSHATGDDEINEVENLRYETEYIQF